MKRGYVQVYTGDGKGKTTAALGLTLRAFSAGKKIFIAQFLKGESSSESDIIERMNGITLKQYGNKTFIKKTPTEKDIELAVNGLKEVVKILAEGQYDIVVLDEACLALHYELFTFSELWDAIEDRAPHVEVIITGRYAPQELIDEADLVTEMKEIKHYYKNGVTARVGIEK